VLHRYLLIPLALAGSVGIGLAPAIAEAATPSSASGAAQQITSQPATADAAALAKAAGLKTYHSPAAAKSIRLQKSVAADATGHVTARAATATASGTTIYAGTGGACVVDTGNGTPNAPYCDVQDAVNAASPGDTIDVSGDIGSFSQSALTITTSDLTIVGTSVQSWIGDTTGPAVTIDGASDVTISNMMLSSFSGADVAIEGSSGVTLDSDYIGGGVGAHDGITIDGASSGITISRTYVDTLSWDADYSAISIASGAKNVTLAGDMIAASNISATGVDGLDVVGDTIQRGCESGIDVVGASTGVYLENNVLEDTNATFDSFMGGYPSQCSSDGDAWAPDITVAAGSTAGTTAEYNDFDVYGTDATDPYSWGGTSYATLAGFQSSVPGQGAHDTNDTSTFGGVYLRQNESDNIEVTPTNASPADGSANLSAPGELSSDFYGATPYNTRGAVQFTGPNPDLDIEASVGDSSAYGVTADFSLGGFNSGFTTVTGSWGDGQQSSVTVTTASGELQHSYTDLGTYPVTLIANDGQNDIAETTISGVQTAGSEYTPYGPTRILDTRKGLGAPEAAVAADKTVKLQVTGAGTAGDTIPAGITAVALNVTVVSPTKNGYLTVWGDQDETGASVPQPGTSNVNFSPGQTVPNLVIVPVGANGVVDIYNGSKGGSQLLADVAGYFTEANTGRYVALTPNPSRLLDTRKGTGTGGKVAKIPAGGNLTLTVAGAGGIPSSDVTAVSLNLTAVDSTANGVITAYPAGQSLPVVSNVNYPAGKTIANMSIVPLGTGGKIVLHNNGGAPVDLLADAFGYYTPDDVANSSAYVPLIQPERLLDTRQPGEGGALISGDTYYWQFTTLADLTAGVFNATVVSPTGNGYLAVYPFQPGNPLAVPGTSNLNYRAGQTVPNLVFGTPGGYDSTNQTYDLGLYLGGNGDAQLLLDLFGFFEDD
jgi:hypothetical protein